MGEPKDYNYYSLEEEEFPEEETSEDLPKL